MRFPAWLYYLVDDIDGQSHLGGHLCHLHAGCLQALHSVDGLLAQDAQVGEHIHLLYLSGIAQPVLREVVERIGGIGSDAAAARLHRKLGEQREFRLREEEVVYCSKFKAIAMSVLAGSFLNRCASFCAFSEEYSPLPE